jgi:hypothetical protein
MRTVLETHLDELEYHAPASALHAGLDDTVWIRGEDLGGPSVEWFVLDGTGQPLALLRLPARLHVTRASRVAIWAWELGDFDVPYVVRQRVRQATRP